MDGRYGRGEFEKRGVCPVDTLGVYCGGGLKLGSGTHGLHTRTSSPPPSAGLPKGPKDDMVFSSSPVRSITFEVPSDGGWTMNWRGMVMRCGEHVAQTTLPHFLQWCFLYKNVKGRPHTGQRETSASGCHCGSTRSLALLTGPVTDGRVLLEVGKAGNGR